MSRFKNDFTDQVLVLFSVMVPALIGSWVGGWVGFVIGLAIAAPVLLIVIRYVNGDLPSIRKRQ